MPVSNVRFLSFLMVCSITPGTLIAKECTQDDILFYLKHGFNHDQVVKLCANTPLDQSNSRQQFVSAEPSHSKPVASSSNPAITANINQIDRDQLYFETVLDVENLTLNDRKLSFQRKECAVYGNLDMTETRDKVCIKTQTIIDLAGLKIVKAVKGIPLLRDPELLVNGTLQRHYPDLSGLHDYKVSAIREQLPNSPPQYNLPVKSGINPGKVAERLAMYQ